MIQLSAQYVHGTKHKQMDSRDEEKSDAVFSSLLN